MFGFLPFGNNAPVNNTNSPNYYQQLPSNLRDFKPQEEEALEGEEGEVDENGDPIDGEYNEDIAGFDTEGESITGF